MAIKVRQEDVKLILEAAAPRFTEADAKQSANGIQECVAKGFIINRGSLIILDLAQVVEVNHDAYEILTGIAESLLRKGTRICIQGSRKLLRALRANGLDGVVTFVEVPVPISFGGSLDLVDALREAVFYTVEVLMKTKASLDHSYFQSPVAPNASEVCGVIEINHPSLQGTLHGTVMLRFPRETYLKLMSKMMDRPFREVRPEIADGAAELLNIIVGQTKRRMEDVQGKFNLGHSIPRVVSNAHRAASGAEGYMIIPFDSEAGAFSVELCTR